MIPEGAVDLERLLLTIRDAAGELLNMDMYDRWGHRSDEQMNKKMEQEPAIREIHQHSQKELRGLVQRYRLEQPAALEYWANAHLALLEKFLQSTTDSTAIFVARQEIAGWQAIKAGRQDLVEENVFYVGPDAQLHKELFGPITLPGLYPPG